MATVKVFSTPTCPYCTRVKSYLDEKNIPFENIDVAGNPNGLQYMITVSGQMGVPVVMIDDYVIVGFDKDKIDAKLGI
ncbi:MAG: NrdH-redoxin [Candidatus Levybacteria bacterium CG_4_9_14_3_um_filter_36_7]|nr:MAG: NrdH-redoxin [Candidatus Omnitrophica bacterium CG1_02_44_16]PIY82746.1 MAG: NrdH-redoxin [Candidatus Omnitrophica bacterium CG_4_10_14_0_8_um_filter_44_12]PJA90606.1 MAG: NrdH-redoxin [Candidatus Levybacteria bacterium CG_4_9_14_3_um_filter_36_7]